MAEIVKTGLSILKQYLGRPTHPRRMAVIEENRRCTRSCSYCQVPGLYSRKEELTLNENFETVDWLYNQRYRSLSYLGGEPFANFETKEDITFTEHTLRVVRYVSQKGMFTNVTTNGDNLTPEIIAAAKDAGLDSMSLTLHTLTDNGLNHLIKFARLAAELGIVPVITTVLTSEHAPYIPAIAARVAENGILYGFGLIQAKDRDFSTGQTDLIPTAKQQKEVAQALLRLKTLGFIRNNKNYINAISQDLKDWKCNTEEDTSIHIGAGGTVDICADFRTNLHTADIPTLNTNKNWRNIKRVTVKDCGGCLNQCIFETDNPKLVGDIPMIVVGLLIRAGKADLAQRWGKLAAEISKKTVKNVNWELAFE